MQKFEEFLVESATNEVENRTDDMINEAEESIRTLVDKHFKSVVRITSKVLEEFRTQQDKPVVTTDGKWNVMYRGSSSQERFTFSDSSSFMKNGKSSQYIIYNKGYNSSDTTLLSLVANLLDSCDNNIEKLFVKIKELSQTNKTFEFHVLEESNKDYRKMNPYSMVKNVKKFDKPLVHNMNLKRDDIIKMVVNGQIETIVVDRHLTDDYRYDGSGQKIDPIEFLTRDVFPFSKPWITVNGSSESKECIIQYHVHSNYALTLIPNKAKIKFASHV